MASAGSILIADDEETFRNAAAYHLEQNGYGCDCAADAAQAIKMLQANHYDLLISDIKMPGNSDLKLVREVQQHAEGIPVILVTGYPSVETAVDSIHLPVVAYMTKPLDFDELRGHIASAMNHVRSRQVIASVRRRLQHVDKDLESIEPAGNRPAALPSGVSTSVRSLCECLLELQGLSQTFPTVERAQDLCELLSCPDRAILRNTIQTVIAVLEKTKKAFKSKELAELRNKLEIILENPHGFSSHLRS